MHEVAVTATAALALIELPAAGFAEVRNGRKFGQDGAT
jgi:hypothetical protein